MAKATKPPGTATRKPNLPAAPLRPRGRTLAEFIPLRRCEQRLLEACREGEFAVFNGGNRPEKKPADKQNRLRPGFVRFLCLGGDEQAPVHEKGMQIAGGWIEGDLDLSECNLPHSLLFKSAYIEGSIFTRNSDIQSIELFGSRMHSFNGDGAIVRGSIRTGSGQSGSVFEHGFRMTRAIISENIDLSNSIFGIYEETRSKLKKSINIDGSKINGSIIIEKIKSINHEIVISMNGTKIDVLCDFEFMASKMYIDGFIYNRIGKEGSTSSKDRIEWLNFQDDMHLRDSFRPQPWVHLIKTFRLMGHGAEADEVAIAFQDQRRKAGRVRTPIGRLLHWSFGLLAGYGYKPIRLLMTMIAVWFACGCFYWAAAAGGGFGPTSPLVFDNPKYAHCRPDAPPVTTTGQKSVGNWYWCPEAPAEYTAFQPFLYSLDLILPLVELQQDRDWAALIPSPRTHDKDVGWSENLGRDAHHMTTNWSWGQAARVVMWFEILFGWIASLLLVAVLTGLTNREGKGES